MAHFSHLNVRFSFLKDCSTDINYILLFTENQNTVSTQSESQVSGIIQQQQQHQQSLPM